MFSCFEITRVKVSNNILWKASTKKIIKYMLNFMMVSMDASVWEQKLNLIEYYSVQVSAIYIMNIYQKVFYLFIGTEQEVPNT